MFNVCILCNDDCPILDTPLRQLIDLFPDLNATVMAIIRGSDLIVPRPDWPVPIFP